MKTTFLIFPLILSTSIIQSFLHRRFISVSHLLQQLHNPRVRPSYMTEVKRVYVPSKDSKTKGVVSPPNDHADNGGSRSADDNRGGKVFLQSPQLLIKLTVPKQKTSMKLALERQQEEFNSDGQSNFLNSEDYNSKKARRLAQEQRENEDDPFLASFAHEASSSSGNNRRSKGKGGNNVGKDESERRGSEGGKRKDLSDRRMALELDDAYDEDEMDYDDENYYGDSMDLGLSSISPSVIAAYDQDGLSLEEIQSYLYIEHTVKASIPAIKRRLGEAKFRKGKNRNRSGKTRREKRKANDLRRNPIEELPIELPTSGSVQIMELADLIDTGAGEIIKYLMMEEGVMATLTNSIDNSVARRVIVAFGKVPKEESSLDLPEKSQELEFGSGEGHFVDRTPVVTIMGHVDHGKTTLLDKIRDARVALGEAGGITQAISAFKVELASDKSITFFDTPGHAAFSEMRKRGANITDIVVLVIAADDGVMDQTKECIAAAKIAGCPIVVAVNKIDKEGADVASIKTELMNSGVLLEEFGGDCQCVEVSAKKGVGIDELLEKIILQAEIMGLKSAVDVPASGTVVEARVDKGFGVVVTALVQEGNLKIGDLLLAGSSWGRVRRILSDGGEDIEAAGPSTPVQVIGLNNVPMAGDSFSVVMNEADAKEVALSRQRLQKQAAGTASSASIFAQAVGIAEGELDTREILKIPLLIKADALGSIEALRGAIDKLQQDDNTAICKGDVVFAGVGDVTSSDVATAAAAKARIVAFNVAASMSAMDDARSNNVEIDYYTVVYDFLETLEKEIQTTLAPPPPGVFLGRGEIKKVFKLGKVGKIGGTEVIDGILRMDTKVRVLRGTRNVIYNGEISSLKVVKEDVQEVPSGSECGVSFKDFSDIEEGDVIECFSLSSSSD